MYSNERLVELKDAGESWTYIGSALGIDRRTAKRRYDKHVAEFNSGAGLEVMDPSVEVLSPGAVEVGDRFVPMRATGNMMVTSDWHVPMYDPKMVDHLFRKADELDIGHLIIGGDLFDMTSVSHYPPHQREAPFELERDTANVVMDRVLSNFDSVDMFWGNHDWRFFRALDFRVSFDYGMRWLLSNLSDEKMSRLRISDLDHMYLDQGDREYRFSHQSSFSKIPLTVARQLAQKYQCSIITAHQHHLAMGVALDGSNLVIDAGGLFNPATTEYIQKTTTHHQWVPGFLVFEETVPTLYSPVFGNL